ncbi:hypothetical protein IE53DRAFT_383984 [Violaceomyces palustris]|uniref:Uncharacterized protein n=1 Tax=Violaceomyces palustris TaxID=1673888 RepID=A0ACD0P625_9BASI|nr:hypothetical protein IE53DRAFT_383984 [Violaceomyces palustris]
MSESNGQASSSPAQNGGERKGTEQEGSSKGGGGLMDAVIDSLFQPGLNTPMQKIMNYSFYGLFLSLTILFFLTGGNLHVLGLFAVALGLYGSVNWFLQEIAKLPPSATQIQQMPSAVESEKQVDEVDDPNLGEGREGDGEGRKER